MPGFLQRREVLEPGSSGACRRGGGLEFRLEAFGLGVAMSEGLSTLAQKRLTFRVIAGLYKHQKVKGYPLSS